jgi:hypothetical protein
MQLRVIIVHEALKVGMEFETFALLMPKISTTYDTFLLDSHPFS